MDKTSKLAYRVIGYITYFSGWHAYALILGFLFLCGLGLPVPEDITLISAGILAGQKKIKFIGALLAGFLGVLTGDTFLFTIGQKYGRKVFRWPFVRNIFTEERIASSQIRIKKHAKKICFTARFLPGLRSTLFLTAGIMHVPFRTFILQDGLAALISVPVWIYVGFAFGENIDAILHYVKRVDRGILLAVIIILLAVIYRLYTRSSAHKEET